MATYGMGCKRDTPHRRRGVYRMALGPGGLFTATPALATGLTSLAEYEAVVMDQGQTSSCEGHSTAQALRIDFATQGAPLDWVPSPDALYRDMRCQERAPNADGTLPPLADTGGMTADMVTILRTCGMRAMGAPGIAGSNSDIDPTTINAEPRLDQLDAEASDLVLVDAGAYAVDLSDPKTALAVIQAGLQAKHPCRIDIVCDSAMQAWDPSKGPLDDGNPDDPSAGGHAMCLTELEVLSDGSVKLGVLNSWGRWGAGSLSAAGPNAQVGRLVAGANWFAKMAMQCTIFKCSKVTP
jgi:hypothetical protein